MPMIAAKRVEIVTDAPLVPRIVAACRAAGTSGHTVTAAISGSGHSGDWSEDRLTGAASKVVVSVIASAARAEALIDALAPVLDTHGLLLSVADVEVVRGSHFA